MVAIKQKEIFGQVGLIFLGGPFLQAFACRPRIFQLTGYITDKIRYYSKSFGAPDLGFAS